MEDKPIDANLLKKMMMGGFSASSSNKASTRASHSKSKAAKRKIEIDLHFEKLFPTQSHCSPAEKLKMQLDELTFFISKARKDNVRTAYIIVGKGEGVLRNQVKKLLQQKSIPCAEVADPPYFGNAVKAYF